MGTKYFGTEEITEEDRHYRGSRFREVRDALFANPYPGGLGRDSQARLPVYRVTLLSVLRGILSPGKRYVFHFNPSANLQQQPAEKLSSPRWFLRILVHFPKD
jgi:hypothetical protein